MGDRGREQGARGAGASLLGSVIAAIGAAAMGGAAASLLDTAHDAHGEEQLIGWVLVGLAGTGAALCLYLALIWTLAAAILVAGPAGRTGRALLPALRVLAPRLARRVSTGAAVATAATGLVLGPALASEQVPLDEETPTVFQISQLLPEGDPAPLDPEAPGPAEPLPSLGWGGTPAPASEAPQVEDGGEEGTATQDGEGADRGDGAGGTDQQAPTAPSPTAAGGSADSGTAEGGTAEGTAPAEEAPVQEPTGTSASDGGEEADAAGSPDEESPDEASAPEDTAATPEEASQPGGYPAPGAGDAPGSGARGDGGDDASAPRTVVVRQGDTLWSITDDLLGPAPEDPSLLASSWPLLHQANEDVIGEDPDLLVPGQVLTVPAALDEETAS